MSPFFYKRVLCSDSFAKYAVAFFRISRSKQATANSLRSLTISASSSDTEREPGTPTAPSLAEVT